MTYTFENFNITNENNKAYSTCLEVAEHPFEKYNPLIIAGKTWTGKTHLIRSIKDKIEKENKYIKVEYVSMCNFVEQLVYGVREEFDVIIIDDCFYLEGRTSTQEALAEVIKYYSKNNKQFVLAIESDLKKISSFCERIRRENEKCMFCYTDRIVD